MITDSIRAFLEHRIKVEKKDVGMVVGLVDEHGSSIVSYGKMDDGASPEINGNTLFEIGSITKTFTALLLQDMIERGEMKMDSTQITLTPELKARFATGHNQFGYAVTSMDFQS
jgi:D-alanyl-D-alanine-carboxypeptidase/D-alanyl-D-alanine-endopeptidase